MQVPPLAQGLLRHSFTSVQKWHKELWIFRNKGIYALFIQRKPPLAFQWRIQYFPEEGAPTPKVGGANLLFG